MTTTLTKNQDTMIKLPNSKSIDIVLGLKHCNQNRALYFKILNSFVKRYQHLNLEEVEDKARTLHSLKGLTATLGMTGLNQTLRELEETFNPILINSFKHELSQIVDDIVNI